MLSIKPKITSTNILENVLPPMAISGHFDRCRKKNCFELTAILYKTAVYCSTFVHLTQCDNLMNKQS